MPLYAVAHGFKRGIYEDYKEMQEQTKNFPQPVFKKFDDSDRESAEKYLADRKATKIELAHPEAGGDKYYAVARGHTIGVFTDYEAVKGYIKDYPQPLHKKFNSLDDAVAYYEKFANGVEVKKDAPDDKEELVEKKTVKPTTGKAAAAAFYAVARGHKTGVYATWAECQEQTKDFGGARFKKFDNEEDAKMFAAGKTLKQIEEAKSKGASSSRKREASDSDEPAEEEKATKKKTRK